MKNDFNFIDCFDKLSMDEQIEFFEEFSSIFGAQEMKNIFYNLDKCNYEKRTEYFTRLLELCGNIYNSSNYKYEPIEKKISKKDKLRILKMFKMNLKKEEYGNKKVKKLFKRDNS